jgi:hypothetical protein
VVWSDSKHYHVWCLLDRLALGSPLPQQATADSASQWGMNAVIYPRAIMVVMGMSRRLAAVVAPGPRLGLARCETTARGTDPINFC